MRARHSTLDQGKQPALVLKLHEAHAPLLEEWIKRRADAETVKAVLGEILRLTARVRISQAPAESLALRRRAIVLLKEVVKLDDKKRQGKIYALGNTAADLARQLKAMPEPPMQELRDALNLAHQCYQTMVAAGRKESWLLETWQWIQKALAELPGA